MKGQGRGVDRIKVLLVDDHPVVRAGLMMALAGDPTLELIGEAGDGVEALQMASEFEPDVVLMDLGLPRLDGIEATRRIREAHPRTAVIILTIYDHDTYVARALRAGASGYLIKDASSAMICYTIKAVHRGEAIKATACTSQEAKDVALDVLPHHRYEAEPLQQHHSLTPREREVLTLLAEGLTNKAIARSLYIAEVTAKKHVQSIIAKMDSSDRTEAAVKAVRAGLVDS